MCSNVSITEVLIENKYEENDIIVLGSSQLIKNNIPDKINRPQQLIKVSRPMFWVNNLFYYA
jgi:hypothetical protein